MYDLNTTTKNVESLWYKGNVVRSNLEWKELVFCLLTLFPGRWVSRWIWVCWMLEGIALCSSHRKDAPLKGDHSKVNAGTQLYKQQELLRVPRCSFYSPFGSVSISSVPHNPSLRPKPASNRAALSLQDVQVDRRVLHQGHQAAVDVFNDEALLGLPLPAALHEQVNLFGTRPRPLQLSALSDALDRLQGAQKCGAQQMSRPKNHFSRMCAIIIFQTTDAAVDFCWPFVLHWKFCS